MPKVTVEWLEDNYVCDSQLSKFTEVFGDSCEITIENAIKALKNDLDIGWFGYWVFEDIRQDFLEITGIDLNWGHFRYGEVVYYESPDEKERKWTTLLQGDEAMLALMTFVEMLKTKKLR